jgi:hypothetical protein
MVVVMMMMMMVVVVMMTSSSSSPSWSSTLLPVGTALGPALGPARHDFPTSVTCTGGQSLKRAAFGRYKNNLGDNSQGKLEGAPCVDIEELVEMGRAQQVGQQPSDDATHR